MAQSQTKSNILTVVLKHMQLEPSHSIVPKNTSILLKISHSNVNTYSQSRDGQDRKFLFILQETDEQTPLLKEGDQYLFATVNMQTGVYSLQCLNYTKIRCSFEVQEEVHPLQIQGETSKIALEQDQSEQNINKSNQKPESLINQYENVTMRQDDDTVIKTSDYESLLTGKNLKYDYLSNQYLKYFKEEFQLWRDFFQEEKPEEKQKEQLSISNDSPSHSDNSIQIDLTIGRLLSHQQKSEPHQQITVNRNMKKTNSQYNFNQTREQAQSQISSAQKRNAPTNCSSPITINSPSQAVNFLDWAIQWADKSKKEPLFLPHKQDHYLLRQWKSFNINKYRLSEFMHT